MGKIIFFRILLVSLIIGAIHQNNYSQKMPADADKVYQDLVIAVNSADTTQLKNVLTKAAFVKMKNEALSLGMNYPKDVFDGLSTILLDIKEFKYLNYKKAGPTVNVYYMYSNKNVDQQIITMWLEEENGKLKLKEIKNRDAKDFLININRKDYSFLNMDEFQPNGFEDEVPKAVTKIDYLAKYDLFGYGYEMEITINGFTQRGVKNGTTSGTVIGGIIKGENTIEFSIIKVDLNEQETPIIGIRAYIGDKEVDVFYFDEGITGVSIVRTFTVN